MKFITIYCRSLVAAVSCMLLIRPGLILADDWATYQHDAAHTGRSSATFDPTLLKATWGETYSGPVFPVVAGNSLYEIRGNGSATLTSYNLLSGKKNWTTTFTNALSPGPPTFFENLLVFKTDDKLYLFDATTGTQQYTVNIQVGGPGLPPTIARNSNNQLVAYLAGDGAISAVSLGTSSGSVMWSGTGRFTSDSMPTVAGDSVIVAGVDQYYAYDQLTGASNHFFGGTTSGGGGTTPAFDAARMQFYVRDNIAQVLTAFSYTSNSVITQKWQVPESIFSGGGSVSIGADGGVYIASAQGGSIVKRDPEDGHILQSVTGLALSNETTPSLSSNALFLYSDAIGGPTTEIFNLNTLAHIKSLSGGRGDKNTPFQSPGVIFNNGYVLYFNPNTSTGGFEVYLAIPEPSSIALTVLALAALPIRRRKSVHHNRVSRAPMHRWSR
jgi:hypothetical protein